MLSGVISRQYLTTENDRSCLAKIISAFLFTLLLYSITPLLAQVDPTSNIEKTSTSMIGINHIGLSVQDLDRMLHFYQTATNFKLLKREKVQHNVRADALYARKNISFEVAILQAPNMLLELTEFHQPPSHTTATMKMPPQGPGMTHTCFQTPSWISGYHKFRSIGADMLSRGDGPVDIGGYGVTYAYAYDPEGNMLELEQLDTSVLLKDGRTLPWIAEHPMWMTQVALITPDLTRLVEFYRNVLGIAPTREGTYANHPRLDDIVNIDSIALKATWFTMDGHGKMLELMQYIKPATAEMKPRLPTDLGYTFSLQVSDIQTEYARLSAMGVYFFSEPKLLGGFYTVFARDIDGNIFSLREPTDEKSMYSLENLPYQN